MTLATKPKQKGYWHCPKCSHRNKRTSSRKCQGCGEATKPKRRVPKHAETLRDDSYERYVEINVAIHAPDDPEDCGCCGRPRVFPGVNEREHGHKRHEASFGKPRGLACHYCNKYVLANRTLDELRQAVAYLERAEAYWGSRDA